MPYALSLYLYGLVQKRVQRKFEKNNTILRCEDIEALCGNRDHHSVIRVLRSAVVDHGPVDGVSYYLLPPLPPLFVHDGLKRFRIAVTLSQYPRLMDAKRVDDVYSILKYLCKTAGAGYVQVAAWHALGRWGRRQGDAIDRCEVDVLSASGGSVASVLGVVLFLEHMLTSTNRDRALRLIADAGPSVRYRAQRAVWYYFLSEKVKDPLLNKKAAREDVLDFLSGCRRGEATALKNFKAGVKEIGLLPAREEGLVSEKCQMDLVVREMRDICGDYLEAVGFFMDRYW